MFGSRGGDDVHTNQQNMSTQTSSRCVRVVSVWWRSSVSICGKVLVNSIFLRPYHSLASELAIEHARLNTADHARMPSSTCMLCELRMFALYVSLLKCCSAHALRLYAATNFAAAAAFMLRRVALWVHHATHSRTRALACMRILHTETHTQKTTHGATTRVCTYDSLLFRHRLHVKCTLREGPRARAQTHTHVISKLLHGMLLFILALNNVIEPGAQILLYIF